MTEWPIVQHWKCCVPQGTGGSNPPLSAPNEERLAIHLNGYLRGVFYVHSDDSWRVIRAKIL